jgi:4-alpha-glucanotransferase
LLLHPTSFPGNYGIGDLGPQAYKTIDFIAEAGFALWQILPLGPTSYGDSPYQCFSAFAGNPYLISFDFLIEDKLLTKADLEDMPNFDPKRVDYGALYHWKLAKLDLAYQRFKTKNEYQTEFEEFRKQNVAWVEDYGLFMALKDKFDGQSWVKWELSLKLREEAAIQSATQELQDQISAHIFRQYYFFKHWFALKTYVENKGIKIIGDIPLYVAEDSSDVWTHPELYYMDEESNTTVVAGVPPDYFSKTGQLWGNPIYRWETHKKNGYKWWIARIAATLEIVDIIRLDHFRGLVGYWEIPADAETAIGGRWVPGPGKDLFDALKSEFGDLPLIAEDLGEITPDVFELRDQLGLPGMKILQFGFDSDDYNSFLPHHYPLNCVAYTGTHDNNTVRGWYENDADETAQHKARIYMGVSGEHIAHDMIELLWSSRANMVLAPLQDFLELGSEARMNFPSTLGGNWEWRFTEDQLTPQLLKYIQAQNKMNNRWRE